MASYNSKLDLGVLIGAEYTLKPTRPRKDGESDADYAKSCIPVLQIPCAINQIAVTTNNNNVSGISARLPIVQWPIREHTDDPNHRDSKLIAGARAKIIARGEQPDQYNLPSHRVQLSFGEGMIPKVRAAIAKKLLLQVDATGNRVWPEGTTEENNAEFKRRISIMMPYELGISYQIKPKETAPAAVAAAPVNDYGMGYGAPAPIIPAAEDNYDDDLPF